MARLSGSDGTTRGAGGKDTMRAQDEYNQRQCRLIERALSAWERLAAAEASILRGTDMLREAEQRLRRTRRRRRRLGRGEGDAGRAEESDAGGGAEPRVRL